MLIGFYSCKKNLINNWYEELKKHSYVLPEILSNKLGENTSIFLSKANVIILNYELIEKEFKRLKNQASSKNIGIILDESAKIKNPESKISKKLHSLSYIYSKKIIMTGTPSANRPEDYWSQIYFLDHGKSLGKSFNNFFSKVKISNKLRNDESERYRVQKNVKDIFNKISEFCIRETKKSTNLNLPIKRFNDVLLEFEPLQKKIYEEALNNLKTTIVKNEKKVEENLDDFLKKIIRLMQITSNPLMLDESYNAPNPKTLKLIEIIDKIVKKNEKVIIWTSYKFNVEQLTQSLKNYNPVILHGGLSLDIRKSNINKFKLEDEIKVMIATPQSSKEGLTYFNLVY